MLYYTNYTVLYYTILCYTILHYTILCYTILHYTIHRCFRVLQQGEDEAPLPPTVAGADGLEVIVLFGMINLMYLLLEVVVICDGLNVTIYSTFAMVDIITITTITTTINTIIIIIIIIIITTTVLIITISITYHY